MTKLFSRWLPCATLAAWSVIMLHFADLPPWAAAAWAKLAGYLPSGGAETLAKFASSTHLLTGRVDSFLIPAFRGYVLAAGIVLGIMAVVFAAFPADAECCTATDCSHPLSRFRAGKWLTFLVLLLPISATAFFSPDSFGKSAIMNRGMVTDASSLPQLSKTSTAGLDLPLPSKDGSAPTTTVASISTTNAAANPQPATTQPGAAQPAGAQPAAADQPKDYLERTPEGYIVAEVLDLLYAAQDNVLRKDFEGKTVQLIGQMMPDTVNNPNGNRFKAVRMFMTCCAADARPVATIVEGNQAPKQAEMTWVKIVGTATFPIENGRRTAVLKADRVEKTEPPAETMLY